MFRLARHEWVLARMRSGGRGAAKRPAKRATSFSWHRQLRVEPLEDRRLLSITVNTLVDENDGIGVGNISLRDAIGAAVPGDTIDFDPALTSGGPATILLTRGELTIRDSVTINGPGAHLLTVDAAGNDPTPNSRPDDATVGDDGDGSRVFNIDSGNFVADKTISITGLTLAGADTFNQGGAIFSRENLNVTASTISGNSAQSGGGIYSAYGTLNVADSTIADNVATYRGGGVNGQGGNLVVTGSSVFGNVANVGAGIVRSGNGSLAVTNSTISGNSATWRGGGILSIDGKVTLTDSTLSYNSAASGNAGGLAVYSSYFGTADTTVTGSTISGNTSQGNGGGIFFNRSNGILTVTDSSIRYNHAQGAGGGIANYVYYFGAGATKITGTTISGNSARFGGGGIRNFRSELNVTGSTISGNSVSDGNGGGIDSRYRSLTVSDSIVSGNSSSFHGGGIFTNNTATSVSDSAVNFNFAQQGGGGISSQYGPLTISRSSVSGNNAGSGGGVENVSSNLKIVDSTFSGNSANSGNGGGVFSRNANVSLVSSTISGNFANGSGGGLYLQSLGFSTFAVRHSTVAFNSANVFGGGLFFAGGSMTLGHTILASNFANIGADATHLFGATIDARYSLVGTNTGNSLVEAPVGAPDANGNLIGGPVNGAIDPLLSGLVENGGPLLLDGSRVPSHALLVGSPAMDAGDPAAVAGVGGVPAFDQRGNPFTRVADGDGVGGARIDIGSIEQRSLNLVVDTLVDEDDGDFSVGDLSLREALGQTNSNFGGMDTIAFDSALAGGTIVLSLGELLISDTVKITGLGDELLSVDASGNDPTPEVNNGDGSRVFLIGFGIDVHIEGLTLTGGDTYYGGGIYSEGNLTLVDSTISGNSAISRGGGIFGGYGSGSIAIIGSTISGNFSKYNGGGIAHRYGTLTITQSTISGNTANGTGGGIDFRGYNAILTVTESTISGNSSTNSSGGGVYLSGSNSTFTGSTISDNTARYDGGGIAARSGVLHVVGSTISGNQTLNGRGGGIDRRYGSLEVSDSTISHNSAEFDGGGLYLRYINAEVSDTTISNNSAGNDGGGIIAQGGTLDLLHGTINNNSADRSGGGLNIRNGTLTATGNTITANTAGHDGAGIASFNANLQSIANEIDNNVAGGSGGGIFANLGTLQVTQSTLAGNSANSGGGLLGRETNLNVTNSTISGNFATGNGGGVYLFTAGPAAMTVHHSTITLNTANGFGGGMTVVGGMLDLGHTIVASNTATFGPDLASLFGTIDAHFNFIGNNAGSGLASTPLGPDANGNRIGPTLSTEPLTVYVEMAAMGDFEAGLDSFLFEYSVDGGAFQPLFTVAVNEATSQFYTMDRGTGVSLDDPLMVQGVLLNKFFQGFTATIPNPGTQIQICFTATNDGPTEAFAWRNLQVYTQNTFNVVGYAVQYDSASDRFVSYSADPDYAIPGDMFGIRSRSNPGVPSLPFDIADDSWSIFPADAQGIISEFDGGRFFGVVDTVNGIGNNTNTATWTFNNALLPLDPLLGPLDNNGGPTRTHAPLPVSPVLNAGDPTAMSGVGDVPATDQRGEPFVRVFDGAIDIGAFERQSLAPGSLVVDTLADELDNNVGPGDFSLREAISAANGSIGSDTITFSPDLTAGGPATIELVLGELAIKEGLTITGPGSELLTIDASGNDPTPDSDNNDGSRVFFINDFLSSVATIEITGLTLTGGDVRGFGGAIATNENLILRDCTIADNNANLRGGGIDMSNGTLVVTDSSISGNSTGPAGGGGIYIRLDATINDSTISGNSATGSGGGIRTRGNLTINRSTISGNTTAAGGISGGGGIYSNAGIATIRDSFLTNNSAINGEGGGLRKRNGSLVIERTVITGNIASSAGGGVSVADGGVLARVTSSTVANNAASGPLGRGGGLFIWEGSLIVTDSTVHSNSATVSGGGIFSNTTLSTRRTTVLGSTVSGNSSLSRGGGIYNYDGITQVRHSTVTANTAPDGFGSGVASAGDSNTRTDIVGSIVAGNTHSDVDFTDGTGNSFQSLGYNLIGSGSALAKFNGAGDQSNIADPKLGPLADNGGPTQTHALLMGSPAIDAGNPSAVAGAGGVPQFDQRGTGFTRVFSTNGTPRIDIGAFERQPLTTISGDYNQNGEVDAADYVVWRKSLGQNVAPYSGADGDGNGVVDQNDLGVWQAHFGQTAAASAAILVQAQALPVVELSGFASGTGGPNVGGVSISDSGGQPVSVTPRGVIPLVPELAKFRTATAAEQVSSSATAARHDEAIFAWLSSKMAADTTRDGDKGPAFSGDVTIGDAPEEFVDSVDAAFEKFAVGGW